MPQADGVEESEAEALVEVQGLGEKVWLALAEGESEEEALGQVVTVPVALLQWLAEALCVRLAVEHSVGVALNVREGEALAHCVGEGDRVPDTLSVELALGVRVPMGPRSSV